MPKALRFLDGGFDFIRPDLIGIQLAARFRHQLQ
jgi:hypothetical protein